MQIREENAKALFKMASLDRTIIDLLRLEQGTRNFIDFLSEVEHQEHLCRMEEIPLTSDDMQCISLIASMKDRTLAEKAIAEEYSLKQVIRAVRPTWRPCRSCRRGCENKLSTGRAGGRDEDQEEREIQWQIHIISGGSKGGQVQKMHL